MNTAIVGIGSNIDADKNIKSMLELLKQNVKVVSISKFLKTKPIGIENQPEFTNGAVKIETSFDFNDLDLILKKIEDDLERDRSEHKYGPRTIDLDIVVWNGKIVDEDYYSRDFLKKSVQEVI